MELNYVSQEKGEAKTIADGYSDKILFQFNLNWIQVIIAKMFLSLRYGVRDSSIIWFENQWVLECRSTKAPDESTKPTK